jgi:hypothetical protein
MNILYPQVERKSQLSSYILAAFAICMAVMLALSLVRQVEMHWSVPSVSVQTAQIEHGDMPAAIPAPPPPAEATNVISTPEPDGNASLHPVPQVIRAPMPSVP